MPMKAKSITPLLLLALIWGNYFIASNKALEQMSSFTVGIIIRFITMILLTIILIGKGKLGTLLQVKGELYRLLLIGLMGFLLDFTAFVGLQVSTTVGTGTALLKTDILFVNLISMIIYKQKFTKKEWLFTFVMLFGVLLVIGIHFGDFSPGDPGAIFFILSALFVSINAFLIKGAQRSKVNPISNDVIAFYNNFVTMCLFAMAACAMDTIGELALFGAFSTLTAALLLAGLGQTLIYVVYYYDLAKFPVWIVKIFLLFMPVVATIGSYLFFREAITLRQGIGMIIVLVGACGILVTQRKKEVAALSEQM